MYILTLMLIAVTGFIQNMAFTLVSRSRNGGDPERHRYAAWGSNGIWFLMQLFVIGLVVAPILELRQIFIIGGLDSLLQLSFWLTLGKVLLTGLVYTLATTEGSVAMMRINLGKVEELPGWQAVLFEFLPFMDKLIEKGKAQVGKR